MRIRTFAGTLRGDTMRVVLIGAGRMGAFHAGTLANLADVDSLSVFDIDRGRAGSLAAELGASVVDDAGDIPSHKPDGIVVCANTAAHLSVIETAVRIGVPIFCEKPLAGTVAETRRII